jgi:glycosyltransferase involved in cell wall biosynthesis
MHIHHIIASINKETGGPAVSATQLNRALIHAGLTSHIYSIDYTRHGPLVDPDLGPFIRAGKFTELTRGWNLPFQSQTSAAIQHSPGIIHNHGCWMAPNRFARQLAIKLKLPLLISPRGMLEPWSMQFRSAKKKLAWHLYERENLASASAFHATSEAEAESIRSFGFKQPIYLIPNGVQIPAHLSTQEAPAQLSAVTSPYFLFLSRIHQKKGIELLLSAWSSLRASFPAWKLVVAGPDLDGYRNQLNRMFEDSPQVIWSGHVAGETKSWLLNHAAFLVLPSYSENFGIVIAEALAHLTPVLTTDRTPWDSLARRGCGWVIAPDEQQLTETLQLALQTPADKLNQMGTQGQAWMKEDFSWPGIADSMKQAYHHILKTGPAPDFLIQS